MLIAGAFRRSANDRGFASFCHVASERLEFLTTEKHRGRGSLALLPQLRHDALDLPYVICVVSGEHADDVCDALLATFKMHTVVVPRLFRKSLQHDQIVFSENAKHLQGRLGIALAVLKYRSPRILIEGLNRNPVRADDQPHAPAADDLGI